VVAQLPATRVVKRMRRARAFAAMSALFAIALVGVLPATLIHSELGATALLCGVATVFAIGECVHTVVLGPLVADLAPPHLLGRYISLYTLLPTACLAIGPAIGGVLLATSPDAIWWGGGLVAAVIGAGFLLSGDRIPEPLAAAAGVPDIGEGPRAATQATN
jgi:MFS family permease